MLVQQIILLFLFLGAIFYVALLIYKSLQAKSGCATGCGKCSAVDFAKIEQQLKEREI